MSDLRELRLYAGKPCVLCTREGELQSARTLSEEELYAVVQGLCGRTLRHQEARTSQGFVTLRGGHRLGLCGRVTHENGETRLREVGSACLRVARQVRGCALPLRDAMNGHLLIVGAPGAGKTTLLRDCARLLGDEGTAVGVCDERGELAACHNGVPQLDVGKNTHVLDGCDKRRGLPWLVRGMCPQAVVTDELAGEADLSLIRDVMSRGVRVLCSMHGQSAGRLGELFDTVALVARTGEIRVIGGKNH